MFQYRIYGLNIDSSHEIRLLERTAFVTPSDLTIEWRESGPDTPDNTLDWEPVTGELLELLADVEVWTSRDGKDVRTKVCFLVEETKQLNFIVSSDKDRISVYADPGIARTDLESLFVGPALSFILRLRGVVCLHASAVAVDGRAIAFTGHSTAGKSTLAAGMTEAGAGVLADDITVLFPAGGERFMVQPGYARVRLRPKAAEFLTADPEALPMVYSYYTESRYASVAENGKFRNEPLPLAAVYLLGGHADEYREPFVEDVPPGERLVELVRNASGAYVVRGEDRAKEFNALASIARTVPVRRLRYAHDIETLPAQCRVILADFRRLIQETERSAIA